MIRDVRIEDIPAVLEIENECFSRPWSQRSFMFELESPEALFSVWEEDGEILGFVIMHRFCTDGEVFNLAVTECARGRGIGGALLSNAVERAAELEIEKLYLEVRRSNETARRLYERLGFAVCGVRKNYYDDPKEDAVLMDKDIAV